MDLLAIDERARAARIERRAADRWWAPDLRVEAGWKGVHVNGMGRIDGFLASASIALPLWDQSRGLVTAAQGQARAAQARRSLLQAELEGELGGTHAEALRFTQCSSEVSCGCVEEFHGARANCRSGIRRRRDESS